MLLGLPVGGMFLAKLTELPQLQSIGVIALILNAPIVAVLALGAF
jgi:hypothetical protein